MLLHRVGMHAQTGQIASADDPVVAGECLSTHTTSLPEGGVVPPQVSIGDRLAQVLCFGDALGYHGFNQVNFRILGKVLVSELVLERISGQQRRALGTSGPGCDSCEPECCLVTGSHERLMRTAGVSART